MLPDKLLAQVQKPARYIGSEYNAHVASPASGAVRVVMCYPDTYEVGMSHLGIQILYHVINQHPDAYCERAFHPHADAAALLRQHGLPLCGLESGTPLRAFDIVGITLQHELTYATALSLLELGGVPALAGDRAEDAPVVIGGGPCACNPEPMAAFFDAFVIGDGEEAIGEVIEAVRLRRERGRAAALEALAAVAGVYVPSRHDPASARIVRRVVTNLDAAPYPTRPVVPFVEIVHDRAQVELARGCTRGCRFCQAGIIYRPVRERRPATVRRQAREIIAATGYDEVSLVSLNCPDYTGIEPLIDGLHEDLCEQRVSVGLPSLRIDTFSVGLARRVQRVRKSGLTFAPEAGSQRLRDAINKGVTEQDLLSTAEAAFTAGWTTIKLYFMIGLPTETDEDLTGIADLIAGVARTGRQALGKRASRMKLNVSVSTLVPKPQTPLQWDGQIPLAEIVRRQEWVYGAVRDRQVSVSCHDAQHSVLEAALARGTRRTAEAILAAYRAGACFDAWSEYLDYRRWETAFVQAGLSLAEEAEKTFPRGDRLPWGHVASGVSREFLLRERERVDSGEPTPDCRTGACEGCGVEQLVSCPVRGREGGE